MLLKEHNIPIYNQLDSSKHNHIMVETATGTGKSFLGTQLIIDYAEKALVICPKRAICHEWNLMSDKITTMTYSGFSLLSKDDVDKLDYDIYILDEVHHIGSQHWGRNIRLLLKDNNKKIIGLTADGHRYSDGGKYVGDMFEEVIYGYDLEKAINNNILPKFTYVSAMYNISPISEDSTKNLKGAAKYNVDRLIKNFNYTVKEMQPINSIIKKHMPEGDRKCIVFVDKIEKINEAVSFIKSIYPKEECLIINSDLPRSKQIETVRRFKNIKHGFIFAVDMFNEGLHIKGVNTLIMFRKTSSPTIFFQELGRALAFDSKDVVVFDLVGNANTLDISSINEDGIFKLGKSRANKISQIEQVAVHDYTKECLEILEQIKYMLSKNKWTDEEIEILKKYYPVEGPDCASRLNDRTRQSVKAKAFELKITECSHWTNEEIEILRKYYPVEGTKCKNRLNNRTEQSVKIKASELNIIHTNYFWADKEVEILKKYYSTEGTKCKSRLPSLNKKHISAIQRKAQKLNLVYEPYKISEEEIEILKKYYSIEGVKCKNRLNSLNEKSDSAIKRLAKKIGVSYGCDEWTDKEIDVIKKYYPIEGLKCKNRLESLKNRKEVSIRNIARKMGVSFRQQTKWTDEELNILRQYYPTEGSSCKKRIERFKDRANWYINNKASHLKISKI